MKANDTITIYDKSFCKEKEHKLIRCSRVVVFDEDKILYELTLKPRIIMLPGGKVENGENVLDCAKRECKEECGIDIQPVEELFDIVEYFEDKVYHTTFVYGKIIKKCQKNLTQHEKNIGLEYEFDNIKNLLDKVTKLRDSYAVDSELWCMHNREKIAVQKIIQLIDNNIISI